ncbi:MAG: hypothetical protein HY660_16205, partial [Armatimonadetes bacterium]|nr:hypothetical protein [Armatimonadota bacterium]
MIDPWAHVSSHSMDEAVDLLAQRSPALWARRRRRLRGLPYGFGASDAPLHQQRPFLRLMMEDQSTVKVYRKPRQVGVSESSVTEVLWCMDTADSSRTLVYTLPSTKLV